MDISANLQISATPVLDTIQDIQTSSAPQFARLGLGIAADATALLTLNATQTSGNIATISYTDLTLLIGTLTGFTIDLSNVTPVDNVTGLLINIPATTSGASNLRAALAISSDATAQRVLDVDIANESGTAFIMRYGATTTLAGTTYGVNWDFNANVTGNAKVFIPLQIIFPSAVHTNSRIIIDQRNSASALGTIVVSYGAATTLTPPTFLIFI